MINFSISLRNMEVRCTIKTFPDGSFMFLSLSMAMEFFAFAITFTKICRTEFFLLQNVCLTKDSRPVDFGINRICCRKYTQFFLIFSFMITSAKISRLYCFFRFYWDSKSIEMEAN
jgi:hypothetical protein